MEKMQFYDVVYTTKDGKTKISHKIKAKSKADAIAIFKKDMRTSPIFKSVVTAVGLGVTLPKGMTKVIAKNIKIEGLSKTTGKILKGFKYVKGGKIVRTKPQAKCEAKK